MGNSLSFLRESSSGKDRVNFFLDTEFIETEYQASLISVGIVCETGAKYYAICNDCDPTIAGEWHRENILNYLPPVEIGSPMHHYALRNDGEGVWLPSILPQGEVNTDALLWKDSETIAREILRFIFFACCDREKFAQWQESTPTPEDLTLYELDKKPDLWGWDCSTDFVLFYRLWGRLLDLPDQIPDRINDLKMLYELFGNTPAPEKEEHHIAIDGALWVKDAYEHLIKK